MEVKEVDTAAESLELESYTRDKSKKLLEETFQTKNKKEFNSYSQGYSYPLRFILLHFLKMVKKLKKVELSGRKIDVEDLPELEETVRVEYTASKIKPKIEAMDPDKVTVFQFFKMLLFSFKKSIFGLMIYIMLENLTKLSSPLCTAKLISLVKEKEFESAFYWSLILIVTNFFGLTLGQNAWAKIQRLSAQFRLGLINLLYDKISNLSAYSVKKANVGKIINMISSDFNTFESKGCYIFHSLLAPLTLTVASIMLCYRLGWVGLLAIALLIGLFPLQKRIAKKASEYTKLQSKDSDTKIKLFSEMMEGIRIIKMYGWEKAFNHIICSWRHSEVKYILINQTIMYIEHAMSLVGPLIIALICFFLIDLTYPDYLDTAIIFSTIELLNLISLTIIKNVGFGLSFIYDFKVLLNRYMTIMSIENVQMKNVNSLRPKETLSSSPPSPDVLVMMENFSAYWHTEDLDQRTPVLQHVNFSVKKGETVSVIGSIGSGKTTLLFAIMQEIPRYQGSFYSTTHLSYAEQEPYILQGSIRDNILFGKSFDEEFYSKVVSACCLLDDFKQFGKGDLTIVGERGSNLSGGQKARVCLARAVYANTDLYLLDDPLSAVDSKVAKKLFKNVIQGMLRDKGVVLVTHQLNYALKCERIAVFDDGVLVIQGDPNEIDFKSTGISKFVEANNSKNKKEQEEEEEEENQKEERTKAKDNEEEEEAEIQKELEDLNQFECVAQKEDTLMKNDGKKEDDYPVTMKTYLNFLTLNPSPWIFLLVLFTFIIQEFLFTGFYKTLSLYEFDLVFSQFYPVAFGVISGYFVFKFTQYSFMSYFVLSTNENITTKMVTSISLAKPVILDEIPSGQIINKFSNDINILDKQLPEASFTSLEGILHFINLIGSVISINKFFAIPGSIEVYFFYKWFMYIKPILMRAKQLDLENKTPIFQFFQSSLNGILIINIYQQKQHFQKRMATLMNNSIKTYDIFWFVSRIFSVYMQYMALVTSAIGIFMALQFNSSDHGQFGQALAFFLLLTNFLHVTLRGVINMDTFMTSSERAFSILNLPKEAIDLSIEEPQSKEIVQKIQEPTRKRSLSSTSKQMENYNKLEDSGIQTDNNSSTNGRTNHIQIEIESVHNVSLQKNTGQLHFENVFMRYKEGLDYVLKGITFDVLPLERIAIVGRTGAGKSSIIQALFRMSEIEISSEEGPSRIIYNSQDTKDLPLQKLRKSISIIPQTPFVFSGSIRRNIDPLEEFTDTDISRVLEETGLNDLIEKLPNGINTDMSDSQSVFSMGQRQLVCLARVMLRNNKLIVLDEATASVDMETDQMIQDLIKNKFKNCTIITIAHRLNTIADYDKVIVLEAGKVLEMDIPFKLLALDDSDDQITNNTSAFSQMVQNTGPKNAEQIFNVSKQTYLTKQKYL